MIKTESYKTLSNGTKLIREYKNFLERTDILFLFWNAKFDLKFFLKERIIITNIYDGYLAELHEGERVLTKKETDSLDHGINKGGVSITIPKLADQIVIREDADIDKIANAFYNKLKLASTNS